MNMNALYDPIEAVRSSCAEVASVSSLVAINDDACEVFASDLMLRLGDLRRLSGGDSDGKSDEKSNTSPFHNYRDEWARMGWDPSSSSSSSNVDLLFELEEEITACAILHMLNIGHGHKHRLKELKLGRYKYGGYGSAYVTVLEGIGRAIVESKQKKGQCCSSQRMKDWSPEDTERCFLLPKEELFAVQITKVLQETGTILLAKGHRSIGAFIISIASPSSNDKKEHGTAGISVSEFVRNLVETIPAFCDRGIYKRGDGCGTITVHFYKKAFLLAKDIASPHRFSSLSNGSSTDGGGGGCSGLSVSFDLQGLDKLTVMADNVLPAVLGAKGVLRVDDTKSKDIITMGTPLPMGTELELELRALSVEACERIVGHMNKRLQHKSSPVTAMELDLWIWGILGKDEEFRNAPRHFTPTTIFY